MNYQSGYAVVDLETTGFSNHDRIIEIGVVLLDSHLGVQGTWETLIQPLRDISNSEIHKITATDVVNAPTFDDVASHLGGVLNGRVLVAHNAPFERRFLEHSLERAGVYVHLPARWIDTMDLASHYLGVKKLAEALALTGIHNDFPHSALGDAQATAELFAHFVTHNAAPIGGFSRAMCTTPPTSPLNLLPRGGTSHAGAWVQKLSQALPASGHKNEAAYREELTRALIDHEVSRSEILKLEQVAVQSGLGPDDVEAINEEFIRQLVVEAWADGVITDSERATLLAITGALGVDPAITASLMEHPLTGNVQASFALCPGDRVAFTGTLDLPREVWTQRATAAGLDVGGVKRTCAVLVAANPDTMSGKAQLAREKGVPIIGETAFAQLLSALEASNPQAPELIDVGRVEDIDHTVLALFPWLTAEQLSGGSDSAAVAAAWVSSSPERPLHELSEDLRPHHAPEATGAGIDRYLAVWSLHHDEMLSASADDLLDLPGVGEKRRLKLVELAVGLAIDGVPEIPVAAPIAAPLVEEPAPQVVEPEPATPDPTPEELLQEAWSSPYDPFAAGVYGGDMVKHTAVPAPQPKKRAPTVFKWSAIVFVASFVLAILLIATVDTDATSFATDLLVWAFLLSGITACIAGVIALVQKLLGK